MPELHLIRDITVKEPELLLPNKRKHDSIKTLPFNIKRKDKQMRNIQPAKAKAKHDLQPLLSLGLLLVTISIAFSTYIVYFGTDGYVVKVMLVPQALFAAVVAIKQFSK